MKKAFHVAYGVCIAAACMLFSGVSVKAVGGVAIDSGNFPDDGFRKIVSEKCDKDKDGELSASEISETKSLIVGDNHDDGFADITQEQTGSIKSVKGIEYFTELTDLFIGFADTYEHRYAVDVTSVDLSKNTKLKKLTLYTKVAGLDLSANTELTDLEIVSENIRTLDIRALKKLENLHLINCSSLTHLDLYTVKTVYGNGYRAGHDDADVPGSFFGCARLNSITFEGDAPEFGDYSFSEPILSVTIFYPKGNKTWKKVKGKNYGGLVTWKAYNLEDGKLSDDQDNDMRPKLPAKTKIGNENIGGYYKVLSNGKSLAFIKPITEEGTGAEMVEINGSVKIGGYNYPVTTIGKAAFKGYSNLKEIYITADLKKVDKNAFTGLNKKNKVTIFIRTKNKKFYNRVRKVLKKAVPKNVVIKMYKY